MSLWTLVPQPCRTHKTSVIMGGTRILAIVQDCSGTLGFLNLLQRQRLTPYECHFKLHFTLSDHTLEIIPMSDTNTFLRALWQRFVTLHLFRPTYPVMMKKYLRIRCRFVSTHCRWVIMIGCSGGLCKSGATVTMIGLQGKVIMDMQCKIISRKVNTGYQTIVLSHNLPHNLMKTYYNTY